MRSSRGGQRSSTDLPCDRHRERVSGSTSAAGSRTSGSGRGRRATSIAAAPRAIGKRRALEPPDADAPVVRTLAKRSVGEYLALVLDAPMTEHAGIGLGRDVRLAHAGACGAGLVAGE